MSDQTGLSVYNPGGLQIQTVDGSLYEIQPGQTMFDFTPTAGGLPVLRIGQPGSEVLEGKVAGKMGVAAIPAPKFFAQKKIGEQIDYLGPWDGPLDVVAIGVIPNAERAYWEADYDEGVTGPPDCHSSNGFVRDARYEGPIPGTNVVPPSCVQMVQRGSKMVVKTVCPLAVWVNGNRPKCGESYVIAAAVREPETGQWVLVQIPFRGTGAGSGKILAMSLYADAVQGNPLYNRIITLNPVSKGNGNNYQAVPRTKPANWEQDELTIFESLSMQWADSYAERQRYASMTRAELDEIDAGTDSEFVGNTIDTTAQQIETQAPPSNKRKAKF